MKLSKIFVATAASTALIASGSVFAATGFTATGDSATITDKVQQVDTRTQLLEQQIMELQSKVKDLSSDNYSTATASEHNADYVTRSSLLTDKEVDEAVQARALVFFGPYLNIRTSFDGSELIVNTPSIRETSRLLMHQYEVNQSAKEAGKPTPRVPHLILSGVIGGQTFYESNYTGNGSSDIELTDAEIDMLIQMTDWVSGFMSIAYDDSKGSATRQVDHSNVFINKAFITVGNLEKTPFYSSVGQFYVPFGRFSSSMIVSPLTQKLARTKERSLVVGYKAPVKNSFYGEAYAFSSDSGPSNESSTINDGGLDFGYDFFVNDRLDGEVGVSFISTIADSSGIQGGSSTAGGFGGLAASSTSELTSSRVPGVDVYASVAYDPFRLIAEYVTATHQFPGDAGFETNTSMKAAKPAAQNVELAYTFKVWDKPSSFAIGYGHTSEAALLGLANRRYDMAYNVSVWQHTLETIEFRREYSYSHSSGAPATGDLAEDLGKVNNVITAQMYVYF